MSQRTGETNQQNWKAGKKEIVYSGSMNRKRKKTNITLQIKNTLKSLSETEKEVRQICCISLGEDKRRKNKRNVLIRKQQQMKFFDHTTAATKG